MRRGVVGCAVLLAQAMSLSAQERPGWHHTVVAGSETFCIALGLPGEDCDPPRAAGATQVAAACLRLALARAAIAKAAEGLGPQIQVHPGLTVMWEAIPAAQIEARLAVWTRFVVGAALPGLDQDLLAVARAKTRLLVDDAHRLYPGMVLRTRARRAMLGRGLIGEQTDLDALDLAGLRRHLDATLAPWAKGAALCTAGAMSREELEPLLEAWWNREGPQPPASISTGGSTTPPALRSSAHPRIDGPFVSAAVAVATDAQRFPAFVVAALVLRNRAATRLAGYRGGEWRADFPLVRFHPLHGDRLLLLNRRGPDGATPQAAIDEWQRLLVDLRRPGAITPADLQVARLEAQNTCTPELPTTRPPTAGDLIVYTRALAAGRRLGWSPDLRHRLQQVTLTNVDAILNEHLVPERLDWLSLRPTSASQVGSRVR